MKAIGNKDHFDILIAVWWLHAMPGTGLWQCVK